MNYNDNKKKVKIFLSSFAILIVAFSIFLVLLFSGSSYTLPKVKVSSALIDKIGQSQKQGTILEINKDEFNQIISMYFKQGSSLNGIEIKGVNGDIKNNKVIFHIPLSYRGFNLMASSEGELTYSNNKVVYKPSYFKIGKIILPQVFVMDQVKGHLKGAISIENNIIEIDKKMIPLQIRSIEVKDNKVFIGILKASSELEEKLKSVEGKRTIEGTLPKGNLKNPSSDSVQDSGTGYSANSNLTQQKVDEMNTALDRITNGLNSAMSSVSTGKQKSVISTMISEINGMKGNVKADPYSSAGAVRAEYNQLSPQEKAELKSAVFSNINGSDINIVSKILGN